MSSRINNTGSGAAAASSNDWNASKQQFNSSKAMVEKIIEAPM